MCCKQRLCSDCSSEILRRGGRGRDAGTPCPFCRHNPFEVQVVASDSEDELESQEARQARMAEDHQLAQVLQDIEEEGLSNWAQRVAHAPTPEKSWLATAQEGRVKALEREVAQLRSMLHSRTAFRARPAPAMAKPSGSSQPTAVASRSNAKTVLCRYHQLGRCTKGAACSYAHGEAELQATSAVVSVRQPANYKTVMCEFFQRGSCRSGSQCTFAHGSHELRAANSSGTSSSAVKNWLAARSLCCQTGLANVSHTMEGQSEIAAWRQRLQDAKALQRPFVFPSSLGAADRKVIHMICDELGIQHESRGEGAERRIHILFEDRPAGYRARLSGDGEDLDGVDGRAYDSFFDNFVFSDDD